MILDEKMSILRCLAILVTAAVGSLQLNVYTCAPAASATSKSCSVQGPISACTMVTATSRLGSAPIAATRASSDPSTSALTTIGSSLSPCPSSSVDACIDSPDPARAAAALRSANLSACMTADFSLSTTYSSCPAAGCPRNPVTSQTLEGPTASTWSRFESRRSRTRPHSEPTTTWSPFLSCPRVTMREATGPRLLSLRASTTKPSPGPSGGARSSIISERSSTLSSSLSTLSPVSPETLTCCTSPPSSSTTTPCIASSDSTNPGSALGRSHLLTAMMRGTCAVRACWITSIVCGCTPSTAETTRITISVAFAPRSRMALKAWCPGVSTKQILPSPGRSTSNAAMLCVIPPASPEATEELRR
mmetsp:Transcript_23565/g.58162  ORF Transcript_23565/g.58162 Transcript_23565/m.58162 type:complete len:362 (+) Transcript_23565:543-1628(+)